MQQSLGLKQSRLKFTAPLLALSLALSTPALSAGTPAGTVIRNQATLDYVLLDGQPGRVPSPVVETVINPVCSASVTPNGSVSAPGQSITLDPGGTGFLRYQLSNAGNVSSLYNLSAVTETASQFTPQLTIYQDTNGNGAVDAGESAVTSTTVGADQTVNLLVRVSAAESARGTAYPNLIASCTSNSVDTAGGRDADNVAQVLLTDPPALALQKTFAPTEVRPGEETTVNVVLSNTGGTSQEAVVTDFLNTADMRDFTFVSGSARLGGTAAAAAVLEYTADGVTWNTTQPQTVLGIRARTPAVAQGGNLVLTFRVQAPRVDATTRRNVATVTSGGATIDASAVVTIRPEPGIALGPQGNPQALPGGELSANDRQVREQALGGQVVCFTHTVQNLGDLPDTITTRVENLTAGAEAQLRDLAGQPLSGNAFVVTLDPQATADFQACYVTEPTEPTRVEATLISESSKGAAPNRTIDQITTVYPNTIGLTKVSDRGNGTLVGPGEEMTYTLSFTNSLPVPLLNVVVRDPLSIVYPPGTGVKPSAVTAPVSKLSASAVNQSVTSQSVLKAQATGTAVEFLSADRGGVLENGEVVWRLGTVQPGETVTLTVKIRVPADAVDGAVLINTFNVTSDQFTTPLVSPPTNNTVFNSGNFTLIKESNPPTVSFGEEVTYVFTVTNNSATLPLTNIEIKDVLPVGLNYIAGSSGYRATTAVGTDFTPVDPRIDAATRTYVWTIPLIEPGKSAQVRFKATVTPEADPQLRNNAVARAVASDRETQTKNAQVLNKVEPLSFGVNNADLVGYVFLDRNRNGVYDYRVDLPCPKARVILANGRIAVTDAEGRYHFRNVREQTWGLRLDPNSVALPSLKMPQDSGLPGSRQVYVRNLTSVDFPLAPDGGDIAVIRDTTLRITGGPEGAQKAMQVNKQVFTTEDKGVYRVQLILSNSQPLPGFTLTDPLPQGAQLVDGENILNFDPLPTGERAVTYRFRWLGDSKAAVTDPTASWRY
ncbi:MAG: DUF11 domain-containing protein [Deinococcus sp.]|uniref:DUF11 domain-containing protein n=1 Tax=Deinococcus sp. TaxID=47478 RepID=UPI0026DD2834|nr:DUF11 domain-containing protein [Deinococcus sp.]MDO4244491.1 DUF11 domain-containing protein [Deinococcus sp.]